LETHLVQESGIVCPQLDLLIKKVSGATCSSRVMNYLDPQADAPCERRLPDHFCIQDFRGIYRTFQNAFSCM
jgi:hypothetical protein